MPMTAVDAVEAGLFGPMPYTDSLFERVGDVVVIAKQGHALITANDNQKIRKMNGRHGALSPAEMYVPWLSFRLDQ